MIDLSYEPKEIIVRIDGEEYKVAERTAEVDRKLQNHNDNLDTMTSYEASLNLCKILLGDDAVKKIFPKGERENLNRMYYIAKAVDNAYQTEYQEMRDKEYEETLAKMDKLAERSRPVIEMIDRTNARRRGR
jgi:hypothetical protein